MKKILLILAILLLIAGTSFTRDTTTDLGIFLPTWDEEDPEYDILVDLIANWNIVEAFANDPLEFDSNLERLEDRVGAMFTGNTETGVTVTYQDADNTVDAVLDTDLVVIAGLAYTDGNFIVGNGSAWVAESGATARASLGLTIGTNVQAYDAGLTSIAALTTAAGTIIYTSALDTYAVVSANATATKMFLNQTSSGAPAWAALIDADVPDNITIDLATLATTVTCTDNESEALACPIVFVDGATGAQGAETDDTDFTYNPSTGNISATQFEGIVAANLVDKSATEDIAGVWTFIGNPIIRTVSDTATAPPLISFQKRDVTGDDVDQGDYLMKLNAYGYHGSAYHLGATIRVIVDATPGDTTDMPARMCFLTSPDGTSTPVLRMGIFSDGDIYMGDGAWTKFFKVNSVGTVWQTSSSTATSGDVTNLRTILTCNGASGGGSASGQNTRAIYAQVVAGASKQAGLLQAGLFTASTVAGSVTAYNVHVLCAHYSSGTSTTIGGDFYVAYFRAQTRETTGRSVTGNDCLLALENEAVQGAGQIMDSAIRIFENVSGDGFTYGIDMNDADIVTDIIFSHGTTITDSASGISISAMAAIALGDGSTAVTQSAADNSTDVATTEYVDTAVGAAGGGDVTKVGTPANSQVGVWTGDGTIEGDASFTYDQSNMQFTGDLGSTGTRITKGWLTNLEVTNDITIGGTALASIYAAIAQTMYIGTTQVAINRSSAALSLAGIALGGPFDCNNELITEVNTVQFNAVYAIGVSGSTETVDWDNGQYQSITIDEACVITFSNAFVGTLTLIVTWSATAGLTFDGAHTFLEEGGTEYVPSDTSGEVDYLKIVYIGVANSFTIGALLDVKD